LEILPARAGEQEAVSPSGSHGGDARRGRLSDKWEHALKGQVGDVWTEPQVFAKIIGPLNSGPGDDSVGSVHFEQISADTGGDLLLYLPGIDFAGVFAAPQFRKLAADGHELWRCYVGPEDRTPFARMVDHIQEWLQCRSGEGRRLVLLGESFGGLLSLAVALRMGKSLHGIVLVNPATSFGRTPWPFLGRALAAVPQGEELPAPNATTDAELLEEMNDRAQRAPYAYLGSFTLMTAVADPSQLGRTFSRVLTTMLQGTDASGSSGVNPVLQGFLTYPEEIAKLLPPATIRFRLRAWLRDGCESVGSELRAISAQKRPLPPALLMLSAEDRLLASGTEDERLRPLLGERCGRGCLQVVRLEDAGHAPLDGRVDLAAALRASPIYKPPPGRKDYVNKWTPPTLEQLEVGSSNIEPISELVSPVFISTGHDGRRRFGLSGLPEPADVGRPIIFVGNHQLLALDLGPLVREFLIEKGFAPRGLAHPINFPETLAEFVASAAEVREAQPELLDFVGLPFELRSVVRASLEGAQALLEDQDGAKPQQGTIEDPSSKREDGTSSDGSQSVGVGENFGLGGGFAKWGAVPVTPRNFFKLMARGDPVLLFPGGAREACHGPGDKYRLFWPKRTDFVRLAARFNALIVPFGSVGSADNVRFIPESVAKGLASLRLLPEAPQAPLPDKVSTGGLMPVSESLAEPPRFPSIFPRLPPAQSNSAGFGDRFYYSFGSPVDLTDLDPKDRDACDAVYAQLQRDVEGEIAWLLEARTRDPYRDFLRRQAFERIANLDRVPREVKAGKLKGGLIRSCGRRAPSFDL